MAKKKSKNSLDKAKEFADILLFKATGGAMGIPCEAANNINFIEARALLDSIIKIHALELKNMENDEDEESAFDIIKRESKNGSKKIKSGSFEAAIVDAIRKEDPRKVDKDEELI